MVSSNLYHKFFIYRSINYVLMGKIEKGCKLGVNPCPVCNGFHPNKWADIEERKKKSEKMKSHWMDPVFREKHKQGMDKTKEKQSKSKSESMKKRWADKNYREKMRKISKTVQNRPERKKLQSGKIKEKWR